MALVFQYGSNMNTAELNSRDRLRGDAHPLGIAITDERFELVFDLWSKRRRCAAADIIGGAGRRIWGVVYEIPDYLIERKTAEAKGRMSLDAIEGEGGNYNRVEIKLRWRNGRRISKEILTYVGKARTAGIQTNAEYVMHILKGLENYRMPRSYVAYLKSRIFANNSQLQDFLM